MKKLLFLLLCLPAVQVLHAQSGKYEAAMKAGIAKLDQAMQEGSFTDLGNTFERIGVAEKSQWLPYYYAAYCQVMNAYMEKDKSKVDAIADKAEALITTAETLAGSANSETHVIRSMIASSRMMVDPQNRWMQYGQVSATHMEQAKQLDPANPRPVYLEAQSKFHTPEQFGGGKSVAAPIFEKSISMFRVYKPETELHPAWGMNAAQYFLAQCK